MKPNKNGVIRIAISGFDGLDNPHPGSAVGRAIREGWDAPVHIDALGYDAQLTGAWMPGVADELHDMPLPSDGDDTTFDRLMEIHARQPLDVVIPSLDLDVPVYARLAPRLERMGIKTLLPSTESIYSVSKLRLPKLCHDLGVRAPKTIHVLDLNDLALHAKQFGFPLVVKGTVAGAKVVGGTNETLAEAKKLDEKWGGGVLLQDLVAGEEFVVAAVVNGGSELLGMACMRKLGINEIGKAVFGAVVDDPRIAKAATNILRRLNWRGPLELEFILPTGADSPVLIEINPRFPSWIMLTHWAGANLPAMLLKEILQPGQASSCQAKAGALFVRDIAETAVPMERVRNLQRNKQCIGTPVDFILVDEHFVFRQCLDDFLNLAQSLVFRSF